MVSALPDLKARRDAFGKIHPPSSQLRQHQVYFTVLSLAVEMIEDLPESSASGLEQERLLAYAMFARMRGIMELLKTEV